MDPKLQEFQAKKNDLYREIKTLADRQDAWTAEDRAKWDQVNKLYDENNAALEQRHQELTNSAAVKKRLAEVEEKWRKESLRENPAAGERDAGPTAEDRALSLQAWLMANNRRADRITSRHQEACLRTGLDPRASEMELRLEFRAGDPAWVCGGRQELRGGSYPESRDLGIVTANKGKETVPQGFMAELERKLLAFGGPRSVCRVIRTDSGNVMPWPTVDDTSNTGVLLAENTTIGASVDPTFSSVTFSAYKFSSKPILVGAELIEDSAFNLGAEIGDLLGERLGRIIGAQTTTGTGSSQPEGVVVNATTVAAGGATAIVGDDLFNLLHGLDPAYRLGPAVGFMMHDNKLAIVRKLKDANGQYLWQPGLQAGVPDRLLAYPATINQHMASGNPVATQRSILFGDFSKFVIRDCAMVRFYRLEERYRDLDQTGFIAFMRVDSHLIQTAAVKALLH